jgi:F-type H+-transporting ATPase subunit epsilon
MAKTFQCSLITPEGSVYDGPADLLVIPAFDGELGVLRDRAPLLARLGAGRLRIRNDNQQREWFVDGGFAQVLDNKATVLTQRAMEPDKIDREKARAQLTHARETKAVGDEEIARKSAIEASARAQLRIAK